VGAPSIDFLRVDLKSNWKTVGSRLKPIPTGRIAGQGGECSCCCIHNGREEFLQLRGAIPGIGVSRRQEMGIEISRWRPDLLQWYDRPQSFVSENRVTLCSLSPRSVYGSP